MDIYDARLIIFLCLWSHDDARHGTAQGQAHWHNRCTSWAVALTLALLWIFISTAFLLSLQQGNKRNFVGFRGDQNKKHVTIMD